jgi:arabinose-5-phosphate isomerase
MSAKDLISKYRTLLDHFYNGFDPAVLDDLVEYFKDSPGLIFLTGVGKSGLIAEKIAVTLTSTGTRALFLSPTDSMHGDIGLVSKGDSVFLISKSGESDELMTMIPYIRNKGARMVALVMNGKSRLARACDKVVVLPFIEELCPHDLAPTISTTEQLIFGDLLAILLMKNKNFTRDQFASNHPAGRIGKRITMKVKDLMIKPPHLPLCKEEDRVIDILVELSDKRAGCLLVTDSRLQLKGIFTDGDLRRALQKYGADVLHIPIKDLINKNCKTIQPEILAIEAMKQMEADQKHPIMVMPVIEEDKKVVGLIKLHDIIQSGV